MKKDYPKFRAHFALLLIFLFASLHFEIFGQSFSPPIGLSGESLLNPTSLAFGPDGRLYVTQQDGTIYAYTVQRDAAPPGSGSYSVTATETINNIKTGVPNHNDDGSVNTLNLRQVTGLIAAGTAVNPVLYVTSSDSRIGGKAGGEDLNLDTNSGVLSRLTWNGAGWDRVDLVRGLPRCEENHATNDMDIYQDGGTTYILLQQGGNTNKGAPSNNFAGTSETYLAGALLRINVTQLEGMTVYSDPRNGSSYIYDLPTLNDPERQDIDNGNSNFPYPPGHPMYNATIDLGDPFGGNDGLNQAIVETGGPVQIFSSGYRNAYDVVITAGGKVYTSDNGPNSGWGGVPVIYDSSGQVKSDQSTYNPAAGDYVRNDFNEANSNSIGDALHYVGDTSDSDGTYYAGHPVPIRAFPSRAGVIKHEFNGSQWVVDASYDFENLLTGVTGYFNPSFSIGDFPDDSRQGEYLAGNQSSPKVNILDVVNASTNGICEYTASNFNGAMQGDILTASFNENINRYELNASGTGLLAKDNGFLSNFGSNPLDIIAQGDLDPFPGTIWTVTYGANNVTVFEPADFGNCLQPGDPGYDPDEDSDGDGYTNGDEIDNGTNHCSGGSQPSDNDGDFISDLNDPDDDNDGIADISDPFAIDENNGTSTSLPINYPFWNNDPGTGFAGLGFTGWMINGNTDYLDQYDPDNLSFGGAGGKATVDNVSDGDALAGANNQDNGFQLGIDVDTNSPNFTIHSEVENPFGTQEAENGQSVGIFIGNGDQDNYLKVVVMDGSTNGDGIDGMQVLLENNGSVTVNNIFDVAGLVATAAVDIYLSINPSANTAQPYYSLNSGENVAPIGSPISLPASFLNAVDSQGMAVGLISTNGGGPDFTATWDFMNITEDGPSNLSLEPDPVDFGTLAINSGTAQLNATAINNGSPASGALNVTAINITGTHAGLFGSSTPLPLIIGPGAGKTIQIDFSPDANTGTKTANLVLTHTGANSPTTIPLTAVLSDIITVSRVNAGGSSFTATDGNINWEANDVVGSYTGSTYAVNTGSISNSGLLFGNRHSSIPSYMDQSTFDAIFAQERVDEASGSEMEFTFPLSDGVYVVNLFMGNSFNGTSQIGERIFDIFIEDILIQDDLDLIEEFGHQSGGMLSFAVPVTDGTLNLLFTHEVENPLINGIEVLDASNQTIAFQIFPILNQTNTVGQTADLRATAYGGDPNESISYSISGQPDGVNINSFNGTISGTINTAALNGGPNSDGIHLVTVTASKNGSADVQTQFAWVINDFSTYRINAGGDEFTATDGQSNWEFNGSTGAYNGNGYSVNTGGVTNSGLLFSNRDSSIPGYIDQATFDAIFAKERFDGSSSPEMEFTIPLVNGDYMVNLYMGNAFSGTSQEGERVFDIALEGSIVRDDFDLITEFGHEVGGMLSFPVTISDGILNIEFFHEIQNPLINAIEVRVDNSQFPPIVIEPIPNQNNEVGEQVNLSVNASGGDPQANFTYSILGQPLGVEIEPTNGQIFGTVAPGAGSGGPNGDGVHGVTVLVSKPGSSTASTTFSWTIGLNWTDKAETENYTARHECSFVQAGDRFFLMGGRENATTIDVYDYTNNSWVSLVNSAPEEFNHFQAVEYEGLIWVIGALKTNDFPSETPAEYVWAFDPVAQTWYQGPQIPAGRQRGSAGLVVYNDKFYVVAGNTNGHAGGFVNWFDEYDPVNGTWTPLADAPNARDHFHAAVINNKLYAVGGRLSGGTGGVWKPLIPEVDVYDFATSTWSSLPANQNIPTPRAGAGVANFGEKLVVVGGEVQDEMVYGELVDDALKITEQFDPSTGNWTRLPDLNYERHGIQAIVSGGGLYVTAGSPNRGGGNQKNMEFLGADSASGLPSIASNLITPVAVDVENQSSRDFNISAEDGNVGIFIRSMQISGPNAADFSIVSGELTNGLVKANSSHNITIALSGTGADRNAVLTINYGASSSVDIDLTNNNIAPIVENPGTQNNNEGDAVSLQIEATDASSDLDYDATNLPPGLSIDSNTGLISGTITEATQGSGAFLEQNGLVIIEAESGDLVPNWTNTTSGGTDGILAGTNSFSQQNGGTIPYQITISTPGVYRITWRSLFNGSNSTEENDSWLRLPNDNNVWFFGFRGNPINEANLIDKIQNDFTDVVFPGDTSRYFSNPGTESDPSDDTAPVGATSNGFLKIFRSGGTSQVYKWQASTSDNGTAHNVYAWFVNPGTYTLEISERSAGHAIDRVALYRVDGPSYSDSELSAEPESQREQGSQGAAENSPYNVEVTVTDDGSPNLSSSVQFIWNIGEEGDEPPVAVISSNPTTGDAPLSVSFTGSNSTDDNGIVSYFWDFNDGNTSNQADPTHVFNDTGTYTVELSVTDTAGFTATAEVVIIVTNPNGNEPPVAVASAVPTSGDAPLTVIFNGGNSTDDVGIVSYNWDFDDDGNSSTDADTEYTFTDPGSYEVTLIVTDGEGLTDSATLTITVTELGGNQPPVAIIQADPTSGDSPLNVSFDGSNSTDDSGIVSYLWDFDDGSPTSSEINPQHTFTADGVYDVSLTVTDSEGLSDMTSISILVGDVDNQAPVAVINADPTSGSAPLEVEFIGRNSTDDFGIVSYEWDFGDGETSNETDPIHVFENADSYTVTLTVTDAAGLTNSTTIAINVFENEELLVILLENPSQEGVARIGILSRPADLILLKINVYDYAGRLINSFEAPDYFVASERYEIPVATLRDGMYFIGLEMNQGDMEVLKLMVKN